MSDCTKPDCALPAAIAATLATEPLEVTELATSPGTPHEPPSAPAPRHPREKPCAASVHADHAAHGRADLGVEHQVGVVVLVGRVAIEDHQLGTAALGDARKAGGR